MWQRRLLTHVAAVPWRNGQGLTRIIAEDNAHTLPEWRLSVADILHDAPFSAFAGWQRSIALLGSGVLEMQEKAGEWQHALGACCPPYVFCGADEVLSSCPNGAVQALNLMVRRSENAEKIVEFVLHQTVFSIQNMGQTKSDYFLFPSTGAWTMRSGDVDYPVTPGNVWHCRSENLQNTVLKPVEEKSSLYCIRV
ncbi:hypothetical protein CSR02_12320 [Acetobacter pomorum]|uniref:HutD family protein n=1 Tax=Acetobacter pomorum TaxID=65959 RepID=A0A2G4R9R0_9PROT|nr:hypothetical protein CSR02_12320 [Acetobacter pomorum]